MSLPDELRKTMRGAVDDSPATLEKYSRDAGLFRIVPQVVAYPADADDVAAIVQFASQKKAAGEHVSVTARAAGTDMSGGPLNDSIILDTKNLNKILEIGEASADAGYAVVEPGVFYRDLDKATREKGWELPCYTASRELNTVGGMVANDSGGEKNLKYGKTARYVEELEVVLSDGRRHVLKRMKGTALEMKRSGDSFEARVYRSVCELIVRGREVIKMHRPRVEKNSSGYALWDIGDGADSLDLARLMAGAQGTLGIITRIRFSLVRPQRYASMVVMFVQDLAELGALVPGVLAFSPDSFESYDDNTFRLGVKYFPEFAAQMKMGLFSLGLSFLPELGMLLSGGIPKLVLMAEFRGATQQEAYDKAAHLAAKLTEAAPHVGVKIAPTEDAARKYWTVRRESFNLLRKKVRGMRTAPFIDDFVVPPATLPVFLPQLKDILSHYDLFYTVAGHVGDGNLHIIPLMDPKRPDAGNIIDELSHRVYDLVLSFGGSITGEHNDGLVRTPYVEKMFGPEMYHLFGDVKRIFDPLDVFNPGKKVNLSFSQSRNYLDVPHT